MAAGGGGEGGGAGAGGGGGGGGAVCGVCRRQFGRYRCPRCLRPYCGPACYARHSERCTEGFFREQVEGELRARRAGRGSAAGDAPPREMAEILDRLREMDAGGGGGAEGPEAVGEGDREEGGSWLTEEAAERLGLAGLSEAALEAALGRLELSEGVLTEDALRCFRRDLQAGDLGRLVGGWDPWWRQSAARELRLAKDGTPMVAALGGEESGGQSGSGIPPPPSASLVTLGELLPGGRPAPALLWHLVDLIFTYCSTLVLYNGDWEADPEGAVTHAVGTSGVLPDPKTPNAARGPETLRQALSECIDRCRTLLSQDRDGLAGAASLAFAEDSGVLLQCGRPAVLCALNDAKKLLASRRTGWRAVKKLEFMMAWANELPEQVLPDLGGKVLEEVAVLKERPGRAGEVQFRTGETS